jgi:drug/metabolite transporter (DMT)-like permease
MAIALSLVAALVYGSSDFFGGLASRRASTIGVVVCSQAMGLLVLALALLLIGGHPRAIDFIWGAVCGIAGAIAIAALYRGLAIGTMGVVSPLSAVLGAAIPMLFGIAIHGERPTWLAYAGIAAALIAVVCVSAAGDAPDHTTHATERRFFGFPAGVPEALIAGIAFGFFFVALAQTRADAGMYPLLAARITSIALLALGGIAFGGGITTIGVPRATLPLVLLCGALDMTSNILYVLAAHIGMLSIVAVLTSLYPAATVGLAAIVLHERLRALQWTGVALAFGGAIAISVSP